MNDSAPAPRRQTPVAKTLTISMISTALLLGGLFAVPAPYAIKSPGPTVDTLGEVNSESLIQISDAPTFESTGQLRFTTVGVSGGPGFPVNFAQVIRGWFDPTRAVYPVETVFPKAATQEQIAQENAVAMSTSQENATYAALSELDYEIPTTLYVQGVLKDSPATGLVETDDIVRALNGVPLVDYPTLLGMLNDIAPGTTVQLGLERKGADTTVDVVTAANEDGTGSRLGIGLRLSFDFPVDIEIKIDNVGGPSAGMIFALGIMDRLTEPDEANGKIIAGTGTMDTSGNVGPIGGIQQKLHGSLRDGATFFLAPAANCNEVVGHVPEGLQVVKVETLEDAWQAVIAIGQDDAADLPTCA